MVKRKNQNGVRERKCPMCAAVLHGRVAMRAHLATHQQVPSVPAPVLVTSSGVGRRRRKRGKGVSNTGLATGLQTQRISCKDVIGVASLPKNTGSGYQILTFPLNPRNVPGTRVAAMSRLYNRWRPVSIHLNTVSSAASIVSGAYIVAWAADPKDRMTTSDSSNVTRLTTMGVSRMQNIHMSAKLTIPTDTMHKWYSFSGEDSEDSHGVVLACLSGSLTSAVDLTFTLTWTVEFAGADLPAAIDLQVIEPETDYTPVFTDSVSDWADGQRLTFKHASGGSVVPWEGINTGVVYTPQDGVKIPYYSTAATSAECKFFSCMIGNANYGRALVCHASEADAKDYQKTGNLEKVIKYIKAGDWATPASPILKGTALQMQVHSVLDLTRREPARAVGTAVSTSSWDSRLTRLEQLVEKLSLVVQCRALPLPASGPSGASTPGQGGFEVVKKPKTRPHSPDSAKSGKSASDSNQNL